MDTVIIYQRISFARKKLGLTQEEVARRLQISTNSYRDLESGKTAIIYKRLHDLCKILEITPEELLLGVQSTEHLLKQQLEEQKKYYERKLFETEDRYKMLLLEKDEQVEVLKTTLYSKEKIIGHLKESKPDY
jgi:transcriptional regulator with XRE-family HTH domain